MKVSGKVQAFIGKASVGGRVMTNSNKMYHVKGELADFDADALYPSAMAAISGFAKGIPYVLQDQQLNMQFLKTVTEYYIEMEVTSVIKHRGFPLGSYYDSGSRNWTNDLEGKKIVVGRMALEDLIHFQKIEFNITRGYYFNEGHNSKTKELIVHLFSERFKMKKEGNPAQQAIKLLMNSIYGKLLQRPVTTDTVIKGSEKAFNKFLELNYNFIESAVEIKIGRRSKYYIQRVKPILNQHNYIHCAVNILDMSKRIMNKVMCLAEDKGIKIYYQDTDSMPLPLEDVPKLAAHYKTRFKKDLIGKGMGQFETDFAMGQVDEHDVESMNNWDKNADGNR